MNTAKKRTLLCMWVQSTHCFIESALIKGNTLSEGLVPMVDSFCLLEEKKQLISTGSIMTGKISKELFTKLGIMSQVPVLGNDFAQCNTMGRY